MRGRPPVVHLTAQELHQLLEHHRFVSLPDREEERDRQAIAVTPKMNFAAEAARRASECLALLNLFNFRE